MHGRCSMESMPGHARARILRHTHQPRSKAPCQPSSCLPPHPPYPGMALQQAGRDGGRGAGGWRGELSGGSACWKASAAAASGSLKSERLRHACRAISGFRRQLAVDRCTTKHLSTMLATLVPCSTGVISPSMSLVIQPQGSRRCGQAESALSFQLCCRLSRRRIKALQSFLLIGSCLSPWTACSSAKAAMTSSGGGPEVEAHVMGGCLGLTLRPWVSRGAALISARGARRRTRGLGLGLGAHVLLLALRVAALTGQLRSASEGSLVGWPSGACGSGAH